MLADRILFSLWNTLVDNDILISKQNDISTFGHFTIDSYTSNGGVYTLALTLVGGGSNGVISENAFYDFAVFTLSSGLADKTFEYHPSSTIQQQYGT